jgi:hypothetical protein
VINDLTRQLPHFGIICLVKPKMNSPLKFLRKMLKLIFLEWLIMIYCKQEGKGKRKGKGKGRGKREGEGEGEGEGGKGKREGKGREGLTLIPSLKLNNSKVCI